MMSEQNLDSSEGASAVDVWRVFPAEETAHKKAWDGVMRADFEAQQELREAGV